MIRFIILELLGFVDVLILIITFGEINLGLAKSFLEYIEKNREY